MTDLEKKKLEAYEILKKIGTMTNEVRQLQGDLQKKEQEIDKLEKKFIVK